MVRTVAKIRPKMIVTAMAEKNASKTYGIIPKAVVAAAMDKGDVVDLFTSLRAPYSFRQGPPEST